LALVLKDPPRQDIEALGLNADVADDKILAAIIGDEEAGAGERILVTADTLRMLKAEQYSLGALSPSEDMRKTEEPDPLELENRELRRQLDDRPKLALGFAGQLSHVTAKLLVFDDFREDHLDEMIEEERSALESPLSGTMLALTHEPPSEREIERYLDAFRKWLRENYDNLVRSRLTVSVDIELRNDGRGTATDIEVSLTVPPPLSVVRPPQAEVSPPPARPEWRSRHDLLLGNTRLFEQMERARRGGGISVADLLSAQQRDGVLNYDDGHPQSAGFHLRALKHASGRQVTLPVWFARTADAQATQGFAVAYRVHAEHPPDIGADTLDVKLKVTQVPLSIYHIER
jgi:hypothetical protein